VVLGLYYMTREKVGAKGEGMAFSDVAEVHRAYESRHCDLQAKVKVRLSEYVRDPSASWCRTFGWCRRRRPGLVSEILPHGLSFDAINQDMTKKTISGTINACYRTVGLKETVVFADQLMYTVSTTRPAPACRSAWTTWWCRCRRPRFWPPPRRK